MDIVRTQTALNKKKLHLTPYSVRWLQYNQPSSHDDINLTEQPRQHHRRCHVWLDQSREKMDHQRRCAHHRPAIASGQPLYPDSMPERAGSAEPESRFGGQASQKQRHIDQRMRTGIMCRRHARGRRGEQRNKEGSGKENPQTSSHFIVITGSTSASDCRRRNMQPHQAHQG